MAEHTRSEIRTLKTRATEGVRIAKQNLDGIAMIMNGLDRATAEYRIAKKCHAVVEETYNQQLAVLNKLNGEQKSVGSYSRKKKLDDVLANVNESNIHPETSTGPEVGNEVVDAPKYDLINEPQSELAK